MNLTKRDTAGIVVGGEPRVDLLPPEVKAGKSAKKTRRSLLMLVALVVVACAAGYVFVSGLAAQSNQRLADEQDRTRALLAEQTKFVEARTIANQLASTMDARLVGTAREVLWREYLAELTATLPAGVVITELTVDSLASSDETTQSEVPLKSPPVATLLATAFAPDLTTIATWLDNLREIRGFTGAWASPAELVDGGYSVTITLVIGPDAFEKRFFEGYEGRAPTGAIQAPVTAEGSAEDAVANAKSTEDEG